MFVLDLHSTEAQTCHEGVRIEYVCNAQMGQNSGSRVDFEPELPDWFLTGLKDCEEGRVVDMDVALEQPPPPNE